MLKGKILKISLFIFMILFYLNLSFPLHAEDGCDDVILAPTVPGDHIIPPGWHCACDPYIPLEFDPNNPEEITCGTDIIISVIEGCPPFIWELSDNGYFLVEVDERTYALSCSGST